MAALVRERLIGRRPAAGGGRPTAWDEVEVDDVRLDAARRPPQLIVELTSPGRPGCRFAYRTTIDDDSDGTDPPELLADLIAANLQEQVEASNLGLPEDCRPGEVTWIEDR